MESKATKPAYWEKPSVSAFEESFQQRPIVPMLLIFVTVLCLGAAVIWSVFAYVVEVAVGDGRVIPAKKVQLVQNLEGGIIKEIRVSEGDLVYSGDVLVTIDPTASDATLGERQEHIASLKASREWMSALLEGREPKFEREFSGNYPGLVKRARRQFIAKREENLAARAALEKQEQQKSLEQESVGARLENMRPQLDIATEQLSIFESLQKQNAASRADVLNARTRVIELRSTMADLVNQMPTLDAAIEEIQARKNEASSRFRAELVERLNDVSVKLRASEQASIADKDRLARTKVQSPVDGIVKLLHTNTVGQIVKPGENIVEIVPVDQKLVIETNVKPIDIAFIHPNQKAVIKITAYDSSIFGNLHGTVKQISADSIVDENGHSFYRVQVQANAAHLERKGQKFPVIPGMVAQVDIVTGEKTIFEYLTKPIHRLATTAFRER